MKSHSATRRKAATEVFKLAVKTMESGMHKTLDREPKGKGWVDCEFGLEGMKCKPDKVKEAIELFDIAYEILPDIVALNQIALGYETIGKKKKAADYFRRMKDQAKRENNEAYKEAAQLGIARCQS